mmetsp:Transcript_24066/g.74179  ORF Transcript_24066/g.74179 Transcript_24066/m.74179 type:complete len:246 (+) Transcript_24066:1272-2009(+)
MGSERSRSGSHRRASSRGRSKPTSRPTGSKPRPTVSSASRRPSSAPTASSSSDRCPRLPPATNEETSPLSCLQVRRRPVPTTRRCCLDVVVETAATMPRRSCRASLCRQQGRLLFTTTSRSFSLSSRKALLRRAAQEKVKDNEAEESWLAEVEARRLPGSTTTRAALLRGGGGDVPERERGLVCEECFVFFECARVHGALPPGDALGLRGDTKSTTETANAPFGHGSALGIGGRSGRVRRGGGGH